MICLFCWAVSVICVFMHVDISGESNHSIAAGASRAPPPIPAAAVAPLHTEDRKWRGETHTCTHTIPSSRMSTSAAAVPPLRIKNEMTGVHTFSISPFPSLVPSLFVVRYYICTPALSFTAPDAFIHIVSIFSVSVGVCGCLSLVVGRPAVSCSSQHVKDRAEVLMNAVLLQWV